jgi:predicted membrane channel-forming protein YqfA (hemolysin III family)
MTVLKTTRDLLGRRPLVPLLALMTVVLAGCAQVGTASLTFWDVIFSMIAFFFWFMLIWIFIGLFGDIFRRNDLSGGMKALWLLALVVLPFLGALIYIATRPKMTAQDVELLTRAEAAQKAAAAVSPADQIAKLTELKAAGAITDAEYEALKAKAMAG